MRGIRIVFSTLKDVFSNFRYVVLSFVVALLFYALNVLIANWRALASFYPSLGFFGTFKLFLLFMVGFINLVKLHSYISLIIISILLGILFSLIYYKSVVIRGVGNRKLGFFASLRVLLGAIAPGCAACGIGLVSALGLGGDFLAVFPFDGLELSILAIALLGIAIYKASE